MKSTLDTIVALATAPGRGAIGIVRISGSQVKSICQAIVGKLPSPRHAHYCVFQDQMGHAIDEGLAIFFPGPDSFTGEDVLELQGHGGRVVVGLLIKQILSLGARLANPGEFSERAFLNDKMDLTQAEAIADLIDAHSEQAARAAIRSLQGEFSKQITVLLESLISLRTYVEAAIDFPDEEIDLSDGMVHAKLKSIVTELEKIQASATQGALLREGIKIVIAGQPNVGKSSLLNQLSGYETAIVADVAGTTRDVLREHILIDGIPLHIVDTAGLRESDEPVELEGIRRAKKEIADADHLLLVIDAVTTPETEMQTMADAFYSTLPPKSKLTMIRNKIDLTAELSEKKQYGPHTVIKVSAKKNQGIDLLRQHLKECAGMTTIPEDIVSARRRHMDALHHTHQALKRSETQLLEFKALELVAEELRIAQQYLSEITGAFTSDDLLGRIFSTFCIGK